MLTKYIAISNIAGNNQNGKTYGEILEKIKAIRKTNSDQSDQIKIEKEGMTEQMSALLTVNLSKKIFSKVNNKDCFTYSVIFQNISAKNIKLIIGSISLNDLLDREIKNIQIVLDEELRGNSFLKKEFTVEYDHSNENDKRIRVKELIDLRVIWNPVRIIFADGTLAE